MYWKYRITENLFNKPVNGHFSLVFVPENESWLVPCLAVGRCAVAGYGNLYKNFYYFFKKICQCFDIIHLLSDNTHNLMFHNWKWKNVNYFYLLFSLFNRDMFILLSHHESLIILKTILNYRPLKLQNSKCYIKVHLSSPGKI